MLVIAGIVDEGTPKGAYQAGINKYDFEFAQEEFEWIENRFQQRKSVTRRLFCERFPEFEYVRPKEKLADLYDELKTERAYSSVASLIESVSETLLPENAVDTAEHMREVLGDVVKLYSPHSDISIKGHKDHLELIKHNRALAKAGQTVGMPLLIPTLDYYWDGFQPGRLIAILGRPGQMKSFMIAWIAWVSIKTGYNIAIFSPEMNEFEHTCRIHTLASADPAIQKACDLKQSFRNRDLMRGTNFDLKAYRRFCEYFDTLPGNCTIFTKKYRKNPITSQYIAARVEDLGLHGVLADPVTKISAGLKKNDNAIWDAYDKVHAFQEMLEEHNIFGIATNWATRQPGKAKSEKAPDLDDSFGSDVLAQESDHVMGLKYDEEEHTLLIRCSKSRFGKNTFNVVIEAFPNTGHWQEVNISSEVQLFRAGLNGKAAANGSQAKKKVEKYRPIKAKPLVGAN